MSHYQQIVLASRPTGAPVAENFRLESRPMPLPGDGELLVRARYLSLDPYMRGRMSDAKSYAKPVEIGEPMESETVAEVVESRSIGRATSSRRASVGGCTRRSESPACAAPIPA
jgi:NADPH-dependent curcumin reductase CurA